ncbi:MAG: hypothetical protein MR890_09010, partial [Akkermansia muciniphila]|nr:hypothetical protein [Akkermansia muciniphila]
MRRRTKVLLTAAALLLLAAGAYWLAPLLAETPDLPTAQDTRLTDRHGQMLGFALNARGYREQSL